MLSRTASNLFWLGRHMERAETASRLFEVGARITLLPNTTEGYQNEWESLLRASAASQLYHQAYDALTEENMEKFMIFDRSNPSSVASCIYNARESGRIVRTALTSRVWDALNVAWQEIRAMEAGQEDAADLADMVARHASTVQGAIDGTQLRNDGFHFMKLGYALERADSTARILDVKYFVLLPRVEFVGSGLDSYQWQVILRALSAHRSFHWAYGEDVSAGRVAHFLILNGEAPRSLITSVQEALWHLETLVRRYGDMVPHTARDRAQALADRMNALNVDDIFDEGLHEFLTDFIIEIGQVASCVQADYFHGRG
ncbi:alpha-E domain-containing protein [Paracoccus aerodenitrificans]|uniref:alpha-E domain-containing protein n=1 Tax=Paracoccus aerodenitrificans TaxID=3017781 RepID=UPI0022F065FE|nr:alpha-E domain-containing protein [Paracoccus aerodenitrificans]WBU64575.1 alpha-E domain-containing protein [Paracoccus aerodenitrificans]